MRSVETAKYFLDNLLAYFGAKKIKHIKPADIEHYKQKRLDTPIISHKKDEERKKIEVKRRRSIAGVNRELALLRAILNHAVYNGLLIRSLFQNSKGLVSLADENKRERVLTFEEENKLLIACIADITRDYTRKGILFLLISFYLYHSKFD